MKTSMVTVAEPLIALHQLAKRFETGLLALEGLSLTIAPGEFVALLGPSGCGKSTVLKLVAGLTEPTEGTVSSPAQADPTGRSTAFVFQEPTLMPWATVFENVWLPLRLQGQTRFEAMPVVSRVLAQVGLSDFVQSHPSELSGGMKMRVSIARALVSQPQVLLMDEPFAALDDLTRQRLNVDLLKWWQGGSMATLFVTHNVAEAVFLSQRVVVLGSRPGKIMAEVTIEEAYPRAATFRETPAFLRHCQRLSAALNGANSTESTRL
ncbi:MAG: nitrate/sulfonate/bicarbonate ABC transporter ATP-binding protein [Alcaligenaceae bacterium]|nr:MAG: nitrate/sulfonate/bicarbonate ABC transporter ATP-binding protein [Alcaligenaceae bacterium]